MAKGLFDRAGDCDDYVAATGCNGGVGASRPVTDMPENAGAGAGQGEDGGDAVCVDDVGSEIAHDAREGLSGAYE